MAASLFSPCPPHFMFPANPDDPGDERMRCEKCEEILDPADIDPAVLATGRDRQQAEDEATRGEAVPLVRHRDGLVVF